MIKKVDERLLKLYPIPRKLLLEIIFSRKVVK